MNHIDLVVQKFPYLRQKLYQIDKIQECLDRMINRPLRFLCLIVYNALFLFISLFAYLIGRRLHYTSGYKTPIHFIYLRSKQTKIVKIAKSIRKREYKAKDPSYFNQLTNSEWENWF